MADHAEQLIVSGHAADAVPMQRKAVDRMRQHPAAVIPLYEELVEKHVLNSADKRRYRWAIELLPALRDAYGDPDAFSLYLAGLRRRHAVRPAFIKALDLWSAGRP